MPGTRTNHSQGGKAFPFVLPEPDPAIPLDNPAKSSEYNISIEKIPGPMIQIRSNFAEKIQGFFCEDSGFKNFSQDFYSLS